MTRQPVLFIQGAGDMWAPDGSGVLVKYLEKSLGAEYDVIAPEMPDAETDPRYIPWRNRIDAELRAMDRAVVLVGHSLGGSVLLKYLAEGPPRVSIAGLFLISIPWWGPEGWAYEEFALPDDFAPRLPTVPIYLYHSRDDPHVEFTHLALYEGAYRTRPRARSMARSTPSWTACPLWSTTFDTKWIGPAPRSREGPCPARSAGQHWLLLVEFISLKRYRWRSGRPARQVSMDHTARPGEPTGLEGVTKTMLWLSHVFSDQRWEIRNVIGEGDMVMVHATHHGRQTGDFMGIPPTNRDIATEHVHILRFQDGKAIEHWGVADMLSVMAQLGVMPDRPAPALVS